MKNPRAGDTSGRALISSPGIWVATIVAFFGQMILQNLSPGSPELALGQLVAVVLFLLAIVLFGIGARPPLRARPRLEFESARGPGNAGLWYLPKSLLFAALAPAALAILLFLWQGETPAVIALWVAGLVAILLIQFLKVRFALPAGLVQEWPYLLALLLVLCLAVFTRVYRIDALPYNFDGDFASFGLEARALISGTQPQIFRFGWGPAPLLGALPGALGLLLFGDSLVGVRLTGLIPGVLSILGVYLLGRDFFNPRVGVMAAALTAASYVHLAASRQIHYMDPVGFLVFAVYFFILGLREERGWAIVGSGIATAMCLVYFPGRLVLPVIAFVLAFLLLFHRRLLVRRSGWLVLWMVAGLVTLGPMNVVHIRHAQDLVSHTSGVFILNPEVVRHTMGGFKVNTLPAMLLEQARRSALMFHYYWNTDTQLGMRLPFLDPITAPLFTLGIGVAVLSLRRLGSALLLVWTFLGVLIGCFLTVNPPYWVRLLVLVPPTALLAALGLEGILRGLEKSWRPPTRTAQAIAITSVCLLLLWIGLRNWNVYVRETGTYATGPTRFARYMLEQPSSARGYILSTVGWNHRMREFDYLIPGRLVDDVTPEQVRAGLQPVGSPTLLILTPEQTELLEELPQLYPGGSLSTLPYNSPDSVGFHVYQLP
jgi:hypothetical protein